nr:flagellar hook-associated protein FlgK [Nesterenkonia sandarakina]
MNTAWTGMSAARRSLETAGQNIANVGVEGYTRQRVETASAAGVSTIGRLSGPSSAGHGVSVTGIARLADAQLDERARGTAAISAQTGAISAGLSTLESSLREPGSAGLSAALNDFWAGWQDVANQPGEPAPAAVVIARGTALAQQLGALHGEFTQQWDTQHQGLRAEVAEVNALAERVGTLNAQIRSATASGADSGAMLDQRTQLTARLAELTGATVRAQPDGTTDVLLSGTPLVAGTSARTLELAGGSRLQDAAAPQLRWSHRAADDAGSTLSLESGALGARLALLAPAEPDGTGGALAQASSTLDAIAVELATQVNAVQAAGVSTAGTPGGPFFSLDPARAAASLTVRARGAEDLAAATPGQGALDGSNAARLAQLGELAAGPDAIWAGLVVTTGTAVRHAAQSAVNTSLAHVAALEQQQAQAGVSLDEENIALLTHQHAYQGAARVLTAVDQMLDTLINRTGVVGR